MVLWFDDCFSLGSYDYRRADGAYFWHPRMDVRRQLSMSHLETPMLLKVLNYNYKQFITGL
jgi:hypothetical protein